MTKPIQRGNSPSKYAARQYRPADTKKKVVVIGGGSVGVETAVHMAQDFKDVSILEVRDRISADGEFSNNYFMFRLMDEYKVKSYAKAFF